MVKNIIVIYKIKYFDFNKFETLFSHPKNQLKGSIAILGPGNLWHNVFWDVFFVCQVKNAH